MGLVEILIIASMLCLNSLFAAYELALTAIPAERLRALVDQRKRGAAAAFSMKNRMEASLAVVQIGITLVGAIAAATGGSGAERNLAPKFIQLLDVSPNLAELLSITTIVLPLAAVTIIAGELIPKALALRNSEWVCLKFSPIMKFFAMMIYPIMLAFEWITKKTVAYLERRMPAQEQPGPELGLNELRAKAFLLRTQRIIGMEQEKIILGAANLNLAALKQILVPPEDIAMLYADGPLTDHLVTVHLEGYTRFPVTEQPNDPQAIIGYVNLKELLFLAKTQPNNPSVRQILSP